MQKERGKWNFGAAAHPEQLVCVVAEGSEVHGARPPKRLRPAGCCRARRCARALVKSLYRVVCDVYSRGTAAAPSTRVIGIENIFGGYTRTCTYGGAKTAG